jgi:hypothetical protein
MVLLLLIPFRELFPNMKDLITLRHLENMAKIILATGMMVGFAYSMEFFIAWYSGNEYELDVFLSTMPPFLAGEGERAPVLVGVLDDDRVQRREPAGLLVQGTAANPLVIFAWRSW